MLRRALLGIQQLVVKKIRMTEAVSSMMQNEPNPAIPPVKDLPSDSLISDKISDKRQCEDDNSENPEKKFKSDQTAQAGSDRKEVFRRKKTIIFLVYSGKGYLGMQRNPGARTIESDLMTALLKAKMISEENYANPTKMFFQRAARTDKGVSAAGQLCSSMLCIDVEDPVEKINKHLVDQIRVIALQRVTKKFDSKNGANARTYMYMLPTFSFTPCQKFVLEDYRIPEETLEKVNETLKLFKGTRNFHNFTSGKKPDDPSAKRYIMEFEIGKPFLRRGMEFAVITVKGQSFMLHQIRKMIGLTIAIVQGLTGPEALDRAYRNDKCDIPKAPGLGLMLDKVHYDFYNKKYGSDGIHEPILWEKYTTEIEKFKDEYIYPTIINTEIEEKSMLQWLGTLHMHHFDVIKDMDQGAQTPLGHALQLVKETDKNGLAGNTNTDTSENPSSDQPRVETSDEPSGPDIGKTDQPEQDNTVEHSPTNICDTNPPAETVHSRTDCDTNSSIGTENIPSDPVVDSVAQSESVGNSTVCVEQSSDSTKQSSSSPKSGEAIT